MQPEAMDAVAREINEFVLLGGAVFEPIELVMGVSGLETSRTVRRCSS